MKKSLCIFLTLFSFLSLFIGNVSHVVANTMNGFSNTSLQPTWWITDSEDVLSTGSYRIRDGMHDIVDSNSDSGKVEGVITTKISDHAGAVKETMNIIQNVINYALGILSFIALVYLIYHGFLMLSAAGSDKQFDKGKSGIKTAAIALIGIGTSWMIVSLILWVIKGIAG